MSKKNKNNTRARKAAAKRGKKRSDRLKATKKTSHIKSQQRAATKKNIEKKFAEHMSRLIGEIQPQQ